jgi:membrane protein
MLNHRLSRLIKICTRTTSGADGELLQLDGALEKLVHFWTLVVRHFIKNRCLVRASALAFTTLLALIPLLAVAVGITSSLLKSEGEDQIYQAIDRAVSAIVPPANVVVTNGQFIAVPAPRGLALTKPVTPAGTNELANTNLAAFTAATNLALLTVSTNLPADPQMMTAQREAARNIHDYIQTAQSAKLGVTGMVLFIFTAISMLRGVENTFNDIWGVTVERQWWHQLSSYFTIVALGPVVLIAAATLAGGPSLHWADHFLARIPVLGRGLLEAGPLVFLWLTFALFYMLVPNTQVKFSAALFGGFIAGTLWHLNNVFAFLYFSRVATNSAIYGKLGLVPLFMAGLYFSWVILLFGAQVAYAFQNRVAYLQDRIAENVNQRGREFVALRIMTLIGQRFQNGLPPAPIIELSTELGVPSRLTQRVLRTLADAQLVTEAAGDGHAFLPARPLEAINAHHILQAMRGSGKDLPGDDQQTALAGIYGDFARIEAAEQTAAENISVLALVRHLPATLTLFPPASAAPAPKIIHPTTEPEKAGAAESAPRVEEKVMAAEIILEKPTPETPPASFEKPVAETTSQSPAKATEVKAGRPRPASREVAQPQETEFPL